MESNITPKSVTVPQLTLTRTQAAEAIQVSLPVLDAMIRRADHPLPCIRLGARGRGKVLISSQALAEWITEESARNSGTAARR